MSCLQKTFTQEINWLEDLKHDLRQKLSSMLFSMEQGTQKSEASSEELLEMAQTLSNDFYEIHLLLTIYESGLVERLGGVTLQGLTVEDSVLDPNIVH